MLEIDSGLLDFEWMKKKRSGIGLYFVAFVSGEKNRDFKLQQQTDDTTVSLLQFRMEW